MTLESKFSDLFVDAATFENIKATDKSATNAATDATIQCYLPVFPNKLASTTPGANQWFVGTRFLGKKTLIFDNAYQRDATLPPRIGFGN